MKVIGVADSQTEFKEAPLMQWFVLEDSPAKEAKDLKGKKIAVNPRAGSFYYTVLEYLSKNGLSKNDVQFVTIPHNNQEQALRSKQVDVVGLIDPYSVHIKQAGGARILFRAVDIIGENQFSQIFFTKDFIENHPNDVKKLIKTYNRAIDFINKNPREASDIINKNIGVSLELIASHKYVNNAAVKYWMEMMRANNELKDDGVLKPEDVATTQFTK